MPGMVHARWCARLHPAPNCCRPIIKAAQQMPGVLKVHVDGNYLAVIASDEWQAVQAMRALSASAAGRAARPCPGPGISMPRCAPCRRRTS
jgi:hypothetical protein